MKNLLDQYDTNGEDVLRFPQFCVSGPIPSTVQLWDNQPLRLIIEYDMIYLNKKWHEGTEEAVLLLL